MNKYLCLSAADIHGNIEQYNKIKDIVIRKGVSFVFLCGDLLPKTGGSWHPENRIRTIEAQRAFITDFLIDYLVELSEHASVYAIFGNDDFKSNYHLLRDSPATFLNKQTVRLPIPSCEIYVSGYPYISLTPFLQKDWEKWDSHEETPDHKEYKLKGYISENGRHSPIDFTDYSDGRTSISEDLQDLARQSDPKKTVYVFHEPPYDTPLDMIAKDNGAIKEGQLHIGSKAQRKFIEKEQPLLTMHGHIHETFQESGEYMWKNGTSISLTASNDFLSNKVAFVLFSLPDVSSVERHLL